MKKLFAMLLALCMLLAAVPALGEGASGMWYITMADVTLGYFDLAEDGTAKVQIPGQEEMAGTWTADDASVTITVDGDALTFANDGETLKSDQLPLPIGRTEGKLSYDLIVKMMSGEEYELPEGMTDVELTAIAMNLMAEMGKLQDIGSDSGSESGTEPGTEPAASADPQLTYLAESFVVVESYSGYRAIYSAMVKNDTGAPVYIRDGAMTVKDASGNQAGEAKYLSDCGSKYLEPGEVSFITLTADVAENGEYTYSRDIEVKSDGYRTDVEIPVTGTDYVPAQEYESAQLKATVANQGDTPLSGINVVYALYDANGNLLDVEHEELYRHELGANSTLTLVTTIDSNFTDYMAANGIEGAKVEAYAWVENK